MGIPAQKLRGGAGPSTIAATTYGLNAKPAEIATQAESIAFPMNIDKYRQAWGAWDVVREFVTNAIDGERGNWGNIEITTTANAVAIHNRGRSLDVNDFFIGCSSQGKDEKSDFNGRFNEGMKLAIMVGLRLGYDISIRFGNFVAKPEIIHTHGIRTFKIDIRQEEETRGTLVTIGRIDGDEATKMVSERILKPGDTRVLFEVKIDNVYPPTYVGQAPITTAKSMFDYSLQVLSTPGIFIGGILVSESKDYTWGYNFNPTLLSISEGRNLFDTGQARAVIAREMTRVDSEGYWEKIFQDIREGKQSVESRAEGVGRGMDGRRFGITASMIWESMYPGKTKPPGLAGPDNAGPTQFSQVSKTIQSAWEHIFGKNAVVVDCSIYMSSGESADLAQNVKYLGGTPVNSTPLLLDLADIGVLMPAKKFLENYDDESRKNDRIYSDSDLTTGERVVRDRLAEIIHIFEPRFSVYTYEPAKAHRQNLVEEGKTDRMQMSIGFSRSVLIDTKRATDTLIEELTHAVYMTHDATPYHTAKLREMSARMMLNPQTVEKLTEISKINGDHERVSRPPLPIYKLRRDTQVKDILKST